MSREGGAGCQALGGWGGHIRMLVVGACEHSPYVLPFLHSSFCAGAAHANLNIFGSKTPSARAARAIPRPQRRLPAQNKSYRTL